MMRRWLGSMPLVCLLAACEVASVQEAPNTIAHNQCQSNSDCPDGVCVNLQCRARSGSATFQTVLFEVTPPADGSSIAGVQFLISRDLSNGDASLELGSISQLVGRVTAEGRKCVPKFVDELDTLVTANDFSVPARVSFVPASTTLGLYSPRAVVQSNLVERSYWAFSANVAPGTYDIYVEPSPQPDQTCPVPPQLLRGQRVLAGTLPLTIALPEPSLFEFHVSWPSGDGALDGWIVDMIDPVSGRTISNRVPLAHGIGGKTDYVANLSYTPVVVVGATKAQQEDQLLRLSPPNDSAESQALPTVMLWRSALGLFTAGRGTLKEFTVLPSPVHVHGQVTAGNTPNPAAATVTLVATKITGIDPGVLASFVRTVSVGADGKFDVNLLPGSYRVATVPQSALEPSRDNKTPRAADIQEEWLVPSMPFEQAGKVIALGEALPVVGQALDASGDPVATAQVQAVASPLTVQSEILQQLLDGPPFIPRASAGEVSSGGDFSLKTDPGTFDITVRPNPNTGFAWLVMPKVSVISVGGVGLGKLSMPQPFAYRGTVTVPGAEGANVVPSALVRAYIYLKDGDQYTADVLQADSVLQVAETRADKYGVFEVLIPAELNRFAK